MERRSLDQAQRSERGLSGWVAILAAVGGHALRGQFTPEELGERPKWERFLGTARIVAQKQLGGEDAVTDPWQLTLEEGGVTKRALWKNPQGFMGGYLEGWRYAIAAYLMDRFLGLGMIPPTVEKRFRGDPGSCQLWIDDVINLRTEVRSTRTWPGGARKASSIRSRRPVHTW